MRRVVITGIGLVSPLANGREATWERLLAGKSGAGPIDLFDTKDVPCKIACQVPWKDGRGGGSADDPYSFDPDTAASAKERRRIDEFILYALAASDEAVADSGWKPETDEEKERTGVLIGSGIGGLQSIYETSITLYEKGARKVSPFFIPSALINLASGQVSIRHGFKGPNHSVVTACATGAHAIGDSARLIKYGDADMMLAGGSEAVICEIGIAGFCSAKAMSTSFNDTPEKASRPYDKDRDGFVMGEGAGVLLLEELEHARARDAKIYCEITGYGNTADANHLTAPSPEGEGAARCMRMALRNAGLDPDNINYINAHGTSTPQGDICETLAIKRVFREHASNVGVSSTKGAIGHMLGAAGAVEMILTAKALETGIAPPTINYEHPDPECDLDYVPNEAREMKINAALSNSFGFGGHNATIAAVKFTG